MSAPLNDGGPAFPVPDSEATSLGYHGLTVRDYFACRIAPVMLQRLYGDPRTYGNDLLKIAAMASYEFADAMLRVREAKP